MDSIKRFLISWKLIISVIFAFSVNSFSNAQNCQGHTLTMGGWGAPNTSNPNVSYLYANFSNAFPGGIVLGCPTGNTLQLTSPQAITDFLPSGGTPEDLDNSYVNPGSGYSNTLAGQLVSVMLAVGFDNYDEGFSAGNPNLGDFIFNSAPFQGMSVNQFLVLANNFMGGCGTSSFSASDFNVAATAINENFDEGTINQGYLSCCTLKIHVDYDAIKCHGGTTTVHVTATGASANVEGTGDFVVSAGPHTFTVTDGDCTDSIEITITQPDLLTVEITNTPILCYGDLTTLTANANGGTGNYSYVWSNGATTQSIQVAAGYYSVTVTDENLCTASDDITVNSPDPLSLTIDKGDVVCVGGTVTVSANVSGGTLPYTYLWSNGATTQTVQLPIGNHSVTVTDANGCKISTTFEVKQLSCGGFTTVTQGGWGAKAAGNNWGKYRDLNFASAFPTGLTIGAGSRFLKLTTAKAVENFLPSGTTPRALNPGTLINPTETSYRNVLAGQVVALTLNVRFDQVNPAFSTSVTWLGDLVVVSGPFMGWSVNQILSEANKVLGGEPSLYSAEQMNSITDAINNNYDGGTMNLGLLACPCPSQNPVSGKPSDGNENASNVVKTETVVILYPNPTNGEFNIKFNARKDEIISVQVFNMTGKMVADISKNISRNGSEVLINYNNQYLADGIYIVRVKTSSIEKSMKLMIKK